MISASDLLISEQGRIYHLNLLPSEVAERVILVGDPARVDMIADYFDTIECDITHREFHTITGTYKGKRISAMSTGISSDNVDILLSELDALFNIDFATREVNENITNLDIVRLGTCGALQDNIDLGDFVISKYSLGLDGMFNYYKEAKSVRLGDVEKEFIFHMNWSRELPYPYAVKASSDLSNRFTDIAKDGFTVCGGGFFAPQGRRLRLRPLIADMTDKLAQFEYNGLRITNFEMEGAAVAAMSSAMGHRATTICLVVAHRVKRSSNIDYNERMKGLIKACLDKI